MKQILRFCLPLLFFAMGQPADAQNGFYSPGFYVNQHSDTVRGFFASGKNDFFTGLKFKDSLRQASPVLVAFDTCQSITIDKTTYVTWFGSRHMNYLDKFTLDLKLADSIRTEKIPLRLVYQGKYLSLYSYFDVSNHYFMGSNGGIVELEMLYRFASGWEKAQILDNVPRFFSTPRYQDQITAAMGEYLTPVKQRNIASCQYELDDLKSLFKKLNK